MLFFFEVPVYRKAGLVRPGLKSSSSKFSFPLAWIIGYVNDSSFQKKKIDTSNLIEIISLD